MDVLSFFEQSRALSKTKEELINGTRIHTNTKKTSKRNYMNTVGNAKYCPFLFASTFVPGLIVKYYFSSIY